MNSRQKRASLTPEDLRIWLLVTYRFCRRNVVLKAPIVGFAPGVDDRDADLMRELVDLRSIGAYADVRMLQEMAGQDGCSVGGWMGHYRWVSDKWSDGKPI